MKNTFVDCFVINDNENECVIKTDQPISTMKLYWGLSLSEFPKEHYIGSYSSPKFVFERINRTDQRVYYCLVFENGESITFGERILNIPGMYNLRDMGGYLTNDGRRVKWGMLYRGDQLYNMDPKGMTYLESLGFKTIIDFRSKKEIDEYPNKVPKTVLNEYNFSPEAAIAILAGRLQNNEFESEADLMKEIAREALQHDVNAGDSKMINQQRNFVENADAIVAFKNTTQTAIKLENAPLFQHCKGGKDRTGFSAMIQLALLGVKKEYLIYDYMLTRKARAEKNKRYYQRFLELTENATYANYFYSLFDTKEEYIKEAIKSIFEKYNSIEEYVQEVYEITVDEISDFKNSFLE